MYALFHSRTKKSFTIAAAATRATAKTTESTAATSETTTPTTKADSDTGDNFYG